MSQRHVVGVFGGTFDPVHQGHVQMACEVQQHLALEKICLLPSHQPPHRTQPQLPAQQRLQLLKLATASHACLSVDDREIKRTGPSYTVDTLKSFRRELGKQASITWIMGVDAFNTLTQWHQWQQLPKLAHIAVIERPGYQLPTSGILADWLSLSSPQHIHRQAAGQVVSIALTPLSISATAIRRQLSAGVMPSALTKPVASYIAQHHLYGFHPPN
ncbi:MAG: nicotinate-nucleotide adenylyltransferase [Cellvibrionaceae bacterium]|nr:nicotinate-nucleotide adenylyltransferase [Cellvibrionaceae bacterium]